MTYLIDEIIERHAQTKPEKVFIMYKDQRISYGEFDQTCNKVANALSDAGLKQDSKIAFFMPNRPECLFLFYGAAKARMVTVPINSMFKRAELTHCLNKTDVEAVFTAHPYTELIEAARKDCPKIRLVVETSSQVSSGDVSFSEFIDGKSSELSKRQSKSEEDVVLIQFTSGTTGAYPKGVMHTHKTLSFTAQCLLNHTGMTEEDCCYNISPLFHNSGILFANHTMALAGGSQYLTEKFSASRFWDEVNQFQCTYFVSLEMMVNVLLQQPQRPEDADNPLKFIFCPHIQEAFEDRFKCKSTNGYLTTEDSVGVFTSMNRDVRRKKIHQQKGNYVGEPITPEQKWAVVDAEGNEVAPYVLGEIVRIGPGTMKGYYNNPEETAKALRRGWLHNDDIGFRDEEGSFYFVDRQKDIVRRAGENISSKEVEKMLMEHPSVAMAAVIPVPDPIRTEEIKAYIIPKPGEEITAAAVWEFCEPRIADYKIPRYIEFRNEFPMTATNRVKKAMLKKEKEDLIEGCDDRSQWARNRKGETKQA